MGVDFWLARHSDKKVFELGKWFYPFGSGYHTPLRMPKSPEELDAMIERETETWEIDVRYRSLMSKKLWEFVSGGQNFECQGDTGDWPGELFEAGYEVIGSRYYLDDQDGYECSLVEWRRIAERRIELSWEERMIAAAAEAETLLEEISGAMRQYGSDLESLQTFFPHKRLTRVLAELRFVNEEKKRKG